MKTGRKKWIAYFSAGFLGILAALAVTCAFSVLSIQGDSMDPTITKGDHVLINKTAYLFGQPGQGDVVAFPCSVYSEDGEGSTLVKRVVATAGDRVEIRDGALYINERLFDKYAADPVYMDSMEKVTVDKGKVFVLSDNRSAVLDSRDQAVGQLKISELIGKVCFK
ncbi:signal peptidase I [Anaerovorax odorimutans]|uniref:Signal peptidase I n=1 Tax=Anaerovorax odorimutans TaxID=109327 RepID=A0ABT1RPK9_9FIRM|nr:signal peptidase I [Anaerovorax odorimutans]MCQ4637127.1 signal peptidase I [Anaerovorax odorimutans]